MKQQIFLIAIFLLFDTASAGLFSSSEAYIASNPVMIYSNGSIMDVQNTVWATKDFKSGIIPFENLTQPAASGLLGTLYDRGFSCQLNVSNTIKPPSVSYLSNRIALVVKGECDFYHKVYYSQLDGAKGVIIYDSQPFKDDDSFKNPMRISRENLTIPMYYVDNDVGLELFEYLKIVSLTPIASTADNSTTYQPAINLVMYPEIGAYPSAWEFTLIIVVCLLAISFLASVGMHWHLWRVRRQQRTQFENGLMETAQLQQPQKNTLDPASLSLFPTRIIGDEQNLELSRVESVRSAKAIRNAQALSSNAAAVSTPTTSEQQYSMDDACVICLDEFALGDQIRKLPCGHEYHCECIDPWLTIKSASCPLCKHDCTLDVPKAELDAEQDTDEPMTEQQQQQLRPTPSPPPPSYHSFFSSLRSSHNSSPSSTFGPTISADRAEEFSRSWMGRSLPRNMRRQIQEAAQQAAAANRESVIELPSRMTNNTPESIAVTIPIVEPPSRPSRWSRMQSSISSIGRRRRRS